MVRRRFGLYGDVNGFVLRIACQFVNGSIGDAVSSVSSNSVLRKSIMEQNQSTTPNLLRSRFFYTLRGIAIGLVILISGMCIGGGLTALYIWKHIEYVIHHTDEAAVRRFRKNGETLEPE